MNLPILSHIYTQEDRVYVLDKLEGLEQSLFSLKASFEESVHEAFSLPLAEALIESAKIQQLSLSEPATAKQFLQKIQAEIKAIPQVTIRLAYTPSYDLLRSITIWFDAECGMRVVTEYVFDASLVGGAAIELNGKYLDYSLKKLISTHVSGGEVPPLKKQSGGAE